MTRLLQVDIDHEPGAVGARTAGEAHERESASPAMRAPTVEECPEESALRAFTLNQVPFVPE
jgi:hypothetical protein